MNRRPIDFSARSLFRPHSAGGTRKITKAQSLESPENDVWAVFVRKETSDWRHGCEQITLNDHDRGCRTTARMHAVGTKTDRALSPSEILFVGLWQKKKKKRVGEHRVSSSLRQSSATLIEVPKHGLFLCSIFPKTPMGLPQGQGGNKKNCSIW